MSDLDFSQFSTIDDADEKPDFSAQAGFDVSNKKQINKPQTGKLQSFSEGLKDMASFGLSDELEGFGRAVGTKLRGDQRPFSDLVSKGIKERRAEESQAQQSHPIIYGTGQLTGGVLPAIMTAGASESPSIATAASKLAPSLATKAGGILKSGANMAKIGAGQAGLYGFNSAEGNPEERALPALKSAAVGAIAAPVMGAGISAIGKGAGKLSHGVGDLLNYMNRTPEELAQSKVLQRMGQGSVNPDIAEQAINNAPAGTNRTIFDVGGENVERLGKTISKLPGEGSDIAQGFANERKASFPSEVKTDIASYISPETNLYDKIDQITEAGRAKAQPLYQKAFSGNDVIDSPQINNILDTPPGRKALKEAAYMMQSDRSLMNMPEKELQAITNDISNISKMDEAGGPIVTGLNMRTLDYVKKSLDSQVRGAYSKPETSHLGSIINGLKNDLLSELDNADVTGAYAQARSVSGDYLSNKSALEAGYNFTGEDPAVLAKNLKKLSPAQQELFKIGVAKNIQDRIPDSGNATRSFFGNDYKRQQLQAVLGPKEFKNLQDTLIERQKQFGRVSRFSGSDTAQNQAEIADLMGTPGEAIGDIARKGILESIVDKSAGFINKQFAGLNRNTNVEISKILFEKDPVKQQAILDSLRKRASGNDKEASKILGAISKVYGMTSGAALTMAPKEIGQAIGSASKVDGNEAEEEQPLQPTQSQRLPNNQHAVLPPSAMETLQRGQAIADKAFSAPNSAPPATTASPLLNSIRKAESGNNPTAKNPLSSAVGPYQFTVGTWRDMISKHPETNLTMADRAKPEAQEIMMPILIADNSEILQGKTGRAPSNGDIYAAHVLGPNGAAKLINAPPKTPANTLFPDKVIKANRRIFLDGTRPRTAEEVYRLLENKVETA